MLRMLQLYTLRIFHFPPHSFFFFSPVCLHVSYGTLELHVIRNNLKKIDVQPTAIFFPVTYG